MGELPTIIGKGHAPSYSIGAFQLHMQTSRGKLAYVNYARTHISIKAQPNI